MKRKNYKFAVTENNVTITETIKARDVRHAFMLLSVKRLGFGYTHYCPYCGNVECNCKTTDISFLIGKKETRVLFLALL